MGYYIDFSHAQRLRCDCLGRGRSRAGHDCCQSLGQSFRIHMLQGALSREGCCRCAGKTRSQWSELQVSTTNPAFIPASRPILLATYLRYLVQAHCSITVTTSNARLHHLASTRHTVFLSNNCVAQSVNDTTAVRICELICSHHQDHHQNDLARNKPSALVRFDTLLAQCALVKSKGCHSHIFLITYLYHVTCKRDLHPTRPCFAGGLHAEISRRQPIHVGKMDTSMLLGQSEACNLDCEYGTIISTFKSWKVSLPRQRPQWYHAG